MSDSAPKIYIGYGFCEGTHIGQAFLDALQKAGFVGTDEPQAADIFVGHSGGCFLVPKETHAKLVIMVGIPFRSGYSTFNTLLKKNTREFREYHRTGLGKQWRTKLSWNIVYFWNMANNWQMLRAMRKGLQPATGRRVICIRNRDDDCCTELISQQKGLERYAFLSLPGSHDDLWIHSDTYAAIIKAYYGAEVLA